MEKKQIKLFTDRGGVLIGDDNFKILIPNGYGDGHQLIVISDRIDAKNIIKDNDLNYFTCLKSKNVNVYDDANRIIENLPEGEYAIYFGKATILFVKD